MDYNQHTLRNGLRVIHRATLSKVAYCGFVVNAGTRDELAHEHGMAHFVEHLLFKGTGSRSVWSILNGMELVGGELNAYTTKEETFIYSAFLCEHFNRAVGLLGDIVFHSIFPEAEIRKEAEVVIDEIRSYEDNPSELIFDDFEDLIFPGHPLGHNILGDPALLKGYTQQDVVNFTSRYYHPSNAIFFVQGNISFKRVIYQLEKAIGDLPDIRVENKRTPPPPYVSKSETVFKGTSQAHVMLGCRAYYSAYSHKRTAHSLLSNMLGGPGMNSRLNVSLRERRGLVYEAEASHTYYSDTGISSIYFGTDPGQTKRCLRLVENEMKSLRTKRLTDSRLSAVKKQLTGQIGVASENNESIALGMAKSFLHFNKWEPESIFRRIDGLTAELLQEVANEVFDPAQMSTLIYK